MAGPLSSEYGAARHLALLLAFCSLIASVAGQQELSAPSFTASPPFLVEFSNSSGTRIPCSASGQPAPQVKWLVADGSPLIPISGLREIGSDGTLIFPPFRAEHFRQDVHASTYRCAISNNQGTLVSNEVKIKAVVLQPYDAYVYDVFTMQGNTAVMRCNVPNFLSKYITVSSWIRDSVVLISHEADDEYSKYLVTASGELYVKEITSDDSKSTFQCQITNRLTAEKKTSATSGKLFVTDPEGNVPPKIVFTKKTVTAQEKQTAFLPCEAQGNPAAKIKWIRRNSRAGQALPEDRVSQISGSLVIFDAQESDTGIYTCTAKNSAGTTTADVEFVVTALLEVNIEPSTITADIGQRATMTCKATGYPKNEVIWLKDGWPLLLDGIDIEKNNTLQIHSMTSEYSGIYQCFVKNANDAAFGAALLKLGDVPPTLVSGFKSQAFNPGEVAMLQCTFAGNPTPRIKWLLDNTPIENNRRFSLTESINEDGNVATILTIRRLQVQDGGMYTCYASSKAGQVKHSSRCNVRGILGVRPRVEIAATSGQTVTLNCPFYGYPITTITWEKGDILLPITAEQTIGEDWRLTITNIYRSGNSGLYTCTVTSPNGDSVEGEVQLSVVVPPKLAHFSFQEELVREGMRGRLQCVVLEGGLPLTLAWRKDGQPIPSSLGVTIRGIDDFSSILTIASISPRHNGNYTCLAKNPAATVSFTARLAVNVPPKIVPFAFQDDQFFKGMRAQIICAVSQGDLPMQFRWLKDGKPIPPTLNVVTRSYDGHANSLSIESVLSAHTGNYSCVVSNKAATVSHTAQLLVYVSPKILPFSFPDSGIIEGVLARVSCVVYQGDTPIRIHWLKEGNPVSTLSGVLVRNIDEYSSILTIENVHSIHAGNYSCVASNNAATVVHSSQLSVNVPPKIVPFSFQDEHLLEGMLVRVSCVVSRGDLPLTITWLKDGKPIPAHLSVSIRDFDEYSSVLSIDPVKSQHSGNYTCSAGNNAGTDSQLAELKVQVPAKWIIEPMDLTTRSGEDVYLNCQASGLPEPQVKWLWTTDSRGRYKKPVVAANNVFLYSNGTVKLTRIIKSQEGSYFCIASNGVGNPLSKAAYVAVLAPPVVAEERISVSGQKGRNLVLNCSATGDLPMNFEWSTENNVINAEKGARFEKIMQNSSDHSKAISQLMIKWLARKDSTIYKCKIENSYGMSQVLFEVIVQESPEPPTISTTSTAGNRSFSLTWTPSFNGNSIITEYFIQFKRKADNWKLRTMNVSVNGDQDSVEISGLLPATKYSFRVAAKNSVGMGEFSTEFEGVTAEDAPNGPPQNVEVESTDQHTLRVTWKPPRKSHWNGGILGYNIGFKIDGLSESYTFNSLEVPEDYTDDLIYQLTNLKMFSLYNIVVQAYNTKGSGPNSDPVLAMTSEDIPSKPPQEIRCSALSSKSIYVLWEPPSNESVNGILRGYKVLYKPAAEWYETAMQIRVVTIPKVTLQGLDVNTNYTIKVLAFTKVGDGVKSSPVFCKTLEDVPEAPGDLKVLPSSADSVVVAWKSPKNANGAITKYIVYYKPISEGQEFDPATQESGDATLMAEQVSQDPNNHVSRSDSQFLEVKGLKKNKKYAFWVTASSVIGEGPGSKVMAQTVADSNVPAKSASFSGSIKTPWKRDVVMPCKAVGVPPPQRKWMVGERTLEPGSGKVLLSDGTLLINQVGSEDSGNYTCTIYNIHGKDEVHYSLMVQVPPAAPSLDIVSKTQTSVQLQWKPGPNGGDKVRGYVLYYRPDSGPWETKELRPDHHLHTLDGLACGTNFQFYLEAFNTIGTGAPCDVLTISTEGTDVSNPSKDSLIREGSTFATVHLDAWPASGCPVDHFQLEYKPLAGREWTVVSENIKTTQRKLVIPGLTPATWYSLRLTAITSGGQNAVEYNFATHTTSGGTIPPPEIGMEKTPDPVYVFYLDPYIFIPSVALLIVVIIAAVVICVCVKRKNGSMGSLSDSASTLNTWPRAAAHGIPAQYATLQRRDGRDTNPYATSRLPDCFVQYPGTAFFDQADPALMQAWAAGTLQRRPTHPNSEPRIARNSLKHTSSDGAFPATQESTFTFHNSSCFTPVKDNTRPDEEYDQPPVGI